MTGRQKKHFIFFFLSSRQRTCELKPAEKDMMRGTEGILHHPRTWGSLQCPDPTGRGSSRNRAARRWEGAERDPQGHSLVTPAKRAKRSPEGKESESTLEKTLNSGFNYQRKTIQQFRILKNESSETYIVCSLKRLNYILCKYQSSR